MKCYNNLTFSLYISYYAIKYYNYKLIESNTVLTLLNAFNYAIIRPWNITYDKRKERKNKHPL